MQDGRRQLHRREGDAGLLPAVRPPHELGPAPTTTRCSRSARSRPTRSRPTSTRRSATSRRPRSARGSIATSWSSCRTPSAKGGGRRAGDVQPIDRPVRGRSHRGHLRAIAGDRRPGGDRTRRHGRASTARRSRCPTARSWRRTRRTSPTRPAHVPKYDLVAVSRRTARAARWPAIRRCPTSRRRWATSAPSASCSRTCRSWCSAATSGRRRAADTGIMHFPDAADAGHAAGRQPAPRPRRRRRSTARRRCACIARMPPPSTSAPRMGSQMVFSDRTLLGVGRRSSRITRSRCAIPARTPLILELIDGNGKPLFTMTRGASAEPRRVHHPRPAARALQRHLRRLPRRRSPARSWTSRSRPTRSPARRCRCRATSPRSRCSDEHEDDDQATTTGQDAV